MTSVKTSIALLIFSYFFASTCLASIKEYEVIYNVKLVPKKGVAEVTIQIDDAALLSELDFKLDPELHSHIKANGELKLSKTSALWQPPKRGAKLELRAKINHKRSNGGFDARMTRDWAIFRGDDIIPAAAVKAKRGARSRSRLDFEMPSDWHSVNTGWARNEEAKPLPNAKNAHSFIIDNPERRFDRPTGWMIAGKAATRRAWAGNTRISVSAPQGTLFHRMDVLTYLNFVWPELEKAFGPGPEKLLIVGGDDPMWRGGLSATNSLFLHADRPLVSENGTSTLLHEVVHMFTRIRGEKNDDWISEGLAEFYAIELLYRAGGMDKARKDSTYRQLARWSKKVKHLRRPRSSGPVTAKAALLFSKLNDEIQKKTDSEHTIDELARRLIKKRKVSFQEINSECKKLVGKICQTLQTVEAKS